LTSGEPCIKECIDTLTVADIMTKDVVTVEPGVSIREAAEKMAERNVGSVVVVENEQPVGILTERDMVRIVAKGVDTGEPVEKHMTKNLVTIEPEEPVLSAFCKMMRHGIRHLPVVKDGKLVGIVSMRDIVNAEGGKEICEQLS
jgi:CBS domain-containing protein